MDEREHAPRVHLLRPSPLPFASRVRLLEPYILPAKVFRELLYWRSSLLTKCNGDSSKEIRESRPHNVALYNTTTQNLGHVGAAVPQRVAATFSPDAAPASHHGAAKLGRRDGMRRMVRPLIRHSELDRANDRPGMESLMGGSGGVKVWFG